MKQKRAKAGKKSTKYITAKSMQSLVHMFFLITVIVLLVI